MMFTESYGLTFGQMQALPDEELMAPMELLTNSSLPLRAALLADGSMAGYFEFVLDGVDFHDQIGATPYGDGLKTWVEKSPGFHVDNVTAPVLFAVEREAAIGMREPYAGLRYLKKPVELELINTDEHVITNPVERMASQGLSVDWFRFWLQDYEDSYPTKADRYKRWRALKTMQAANEKRVIVPQLQIETQSSFLGWLVQNLVLGCTRE